jgi:meso-butanediol dehydrogenase / (S,S)-butanediol dehydrogenase / diacetyl reductase
MMVEKGMEGKGGEVAFVTGAASGIGAATARRLASRGAAIGLLDLSVEGLETVAAEIRAAGGRCITVAGDVSDDHVVGEAVAATADEFGGLDSVVACAGLEVMGTVLDLTVDDWKRALNVDLTGVFLTARHTVPRLIERGGGAFVAVSSEAGLGGASGFVAYSAAKHGVIGLVRCLALDHGPRGLRANVVCPGLIETPMATRCFEDADEEWRASCAATIPLGRPGLAEEVAAAVAHLTSDEASYCNGMTYAIDGGSTAGYFEADLA